MPALGGLLITMLLLRMSIPLAHRFGLVAIPGQHRRHQGKIPLTGGIAMSAGAALTLLMIGHLPEAGIAVAVILLLVIGVIDDRFSTPYWIRFLFQITAVLLIIWVDNVRLVDLGKTFSTETMNLGNYSVAITVFAGVGVINAINMIDGMDGLAGSLVLVCLLSIFALLVFSGSEGIDLVLLLSAAVVGFLGFNLRAIHRRGARVFMGDAGSMVLGIVLSWLLIHHSQGTRASFSPVVALWILAIPLFDAVGVLLRRSIRRGSPFHADWLHTHHLLMRLGLSVNQTLAVIVSVAALMALVGIVLFLGGTPEHYLFYLFLGAFACYIFLMEVGEYCLRRWEPHLNSDQR